MGWVGFLKGKKKVLTQRAPYFDCCSKVAISFLTWSMAATSRSPFSSLGLYSHSFCVVVDTLFPVQLFLVLFSKTLKAGLQHGQTGFSFRLSHGNEKKNHNLEKKILMMSEFSSLNHVIIFVAHQKIFFIKNIRHFFLFLIFSHQE